jgi:hypothetical protein
VIIIASEILNATMQLLEVLRQIREQHEENLSSNRTAEERAEIECQLRQERALVQWCYTNYLQTQRARVENLGFNWPRLEDIQAG